MARSLYCFRGRIVLPNRILADGLVICRDGRIDDVRTTASRIPQQSTLIEPPASGYIAPGFIDIHVHGGAGADYMDGTPDAIRVANRAHLKRGTTTLFPTTTTGSPPQIDRMLAACLTVKQNWKPASDGARIAGVHLYGPYFAESKVGCHSVEGRRNPTRQEYERYFKTGIVKIATCAAELPGAAAFYRAAAKHGCLITCGHSDSTWTEMQNAYNAGMRHVDHFWCAMSSVPSLRARYGTPMQASMAEFVLANPEMSTEVIADGQHLSRELLQFAWQMKGSQRLCLVTDSNRALGMPSGRYRFGPIEDGSWFESNGKVGFVPGSGLASSVVALDTMVRNMKKLTSAPLQDVIRMASLTPAQRAGVSKELGSLEAGKLADIVVLDEKLRVKRVFVEGMEALVLQGPRNASGLL